MTVQNKENNSEDFFTFIYNNVEFQKNTVNPASSGPSKWWLLLLLVALLAACYIAFRYFKSYKEVQTRLTYEMSDVRNVAHRPMYEEIWINK